MMCNAHLFTQYVIFIVTDCLSKIGNLMMHLGISSPFTLAGTVDENTC